MIRNNFPKHIGRMLLLAICCGAIPACSAQRPVEPAAFTIVVTVAGKPTANVRVRLIPEQDRQAPACYDGVTDARGRASMKSTGEETRHEATGFVVVCESLGDWRIIPPWSTAKESPLTITWTGETSLNVDLPAKAVRRL